MRRDEDGVSAVVSAVLLFTLFSTAFFVWTIDTLPDWVAEREHNHAAGTSASLSRAAADLDGVPVGHAVSLSIDLGPTPVPLLQRSHSAGTLEVTPGLRLDATFHGEQAVMVGGAMVAAAQADLPRARDVATLRAFELAYDSPGNNRAGHAQVAAFHDRDGDGIVDADEPSVVARLGTRTVGAAICGNSEAYLEIRTGSGPSPPLVATHAIACDPSTTASFSINLLAEEYRFRSLLGRLGDDFSFITQSAGAGTGRAAAVWTGTDGATRTAGGGTAMDMDFHLQTDAVRFRGLYQEVPQRQLVLEGGGVVNIQEQGSAFLHEPVFRVVMDDGQGLLRWRILDIAGSGSVAGADSATLRLDKAAVSEYVIRLDGGNATFVLESEAGAAWQQLWEDARVLAGVNGADMVIGGGAGKASLEIGNIPWTLHIVVIHADARVS